ncbi:B-BOX ZINC FINGER PROTEIN 18 [Salix koriyanagi]|uniref:B-BOX ZINC FINGER PROTEIN 18 n=1 Tax=Salix koriyanagi TaxID=2511006 RepID=A0A9Q0UDX6_9ROSI|nr:B-BOX ZINC FINGER PROTEIN 18 [Salix koriyanagi]
MSGGVGDFGSAKLPYSGGSATSSISQWQIDEFLELPEFNQNYGYIDNGSSKADSGKRGDSDISAILMSTEEEVDDEECLGQLCKTLITANSVALFPNGSGIGSCRPLFFVSFITKQGGQGYVGMFLMKIFICVAFS